ncbi:hypothetical protein BDW62DRAFT_212694 [Aspergillus aurantiobrunneus]
MAKLSDLPTEILLLVLSHFNHFMYKEELQALCLSSRRLCSIAQPFLYKQFVREVHCQCCHKNGIPPGRIVPLVLFTRTLISRPDLAACVRSANFDSSEDDFDDRDVRDAEFDADTFRVLAAGFQKLPAACRARWFMNAAAMRSNPYLLVLASQMLNLEHLQLTLGEEGLYDLEPLFTQWSSTEQPYLKNLKSVVIRDLTFTESESMADLNSIMELPRLEEFTLIYLNGDADGCPLFEIEPGSLNISTLSLREACLDSESLTAIVAGCKCLKDFSYYGRNYDGNNISDSCQFDPSELVSILSSQEDNLRTLRCNLDWEDIHPTHWSKCPKYGSFTSFKNLIHLEVDQYPYTAKQELPSSLQCLTIRNISFPIFDVVGSLNMRTMDMPEYNLYVELPNLEHVTLQPRDDIPNGMLEVRARYDHWDIYDNPKVASKFEFACETLWDIAKECAFSVRVEHEVWAIFRKHGF